MRSVDQQKGAVILTVAFALLFLLGFMGIALDFGHLFVVKTELQTAVDSCALAAAKELDGTSNALTRATIAGKTVGNLNKVNFQGAAAGFVDSDITFHASLSDAISNTPVAFRTARYAKCTRAKSGMAPWLLQAMGAFTGNVAYSANQSVSALAVATRASAQSACAIPVQIAPKVFSPPSYGYTSGEWISSLYNVNVNNSAPTSGHFGWANLNGPPSASEIKTELLGHGNCNLSIGDPINTPSVPVVASVEWNSRFGLYKGGSGNPQLNTTTPDATGYAYTTVNWTVVDAGGNKCCAKGDFLTKRTAYQPYQGPTISSYSAATQAELQAHGGDRRLVLAPVVIASKIVDWACVLMLHPIDGPIVTVYLEYVDNASDPTSPCSSSGLAGGTNGPLVPVLVQ